MKLLLQVFEQIEKSMPKGTSKVIQDAERNRRTLEKPASQLSWFEGGAGSNSSKPVPKTTPNGTKEGPRLDPESMQNRAGAAEAFRERFGRPKRLRIKLRGNSWTHFGTSFSYKLKRYNSKHPKINVK